MRNFFQKYGVWLVFTVILGAAALYGLRFADADAPAEPENPPAVRFLLESRDGAEEISLYQREDGGYFVFLPAYADLSRLSVVIESGQSVSLGGDALEDGMDCGGFAVGQEYAFQIEGEPAAVLQFLRSENTAALFLETAPGSAEYMHQNKGVEVSASMALYAADGTREHTDRRAAIRTRGNSTWDYDKKPYALKLSVGEDLLGMGAAANWVLLANASDETNLRNRLVLDFARKLDPEMAPECAYVDVYLNGEYRGLYLLAEKVEVGENRLEIDTDRGDFLCSIDFSSRKDTLSNPFETQYGRTVEISAPQYPTAGQSAQIHELVNRMEAEILSGDGAGVEIDLDSWARKYLVDEIFGNIDADLTSSYFYYQDGVFYAGPVWDYDMTLGSSFRNEKAKAFIAKNAYKSAQYHSPYYSALYENGDFYGRVVDIYREICLPLLEEMIAAEIDALSQSIAASTAMNKLRWEDVFQKQYRWSGLIETDAEDVLVYLEKRVAFLSGVWIEGKEYCSVQFEFVEGEAYSNFSIRKGRSVDSIYEADGEVWYDAATGEVFDFSQPLTEDVILTRNVSGLPGQPVEDTVTASELLAVLSAGVLAALLALLAAADARNRKKHG